MFEAEDYKFTFTNLKGEGIYENSADESLIPGEVRFLDMIPVDFDNYTSFSKPLLDERIHEDSYQIGSIMSDSNPASSYLFNQMQANQPKSKFCR